jgi:hypothetical protein
MGYLVTGTDPTGAGAGAFTDTYREAVKQSRGWTSVEIKLADSTATVSVGDEVIRVAVRATFPDTVAQQIEDSNAFGALVHWIRESCSARGIQPAQVLALLTDDDLWFAADRAEDPAAFLASRVRDV